MGSQLPASWVMATFNVPAACAGAAAASARANGQRRAQRAGGLGEGKHERLQGRLGRR